MSGMEIRKQVVKRLLCYGAMLAALTVLVALAFYTPWFVFQIQDGVRCGGTVLGKQESMDAEALGTAYEKSLAKRMQGFAEGLAAGDRFYVTSRNLEVDGELKKHLYTSEKGMFQENIRMYYELGLLTTELMDENFYTVEVWKRYVIYSDDYARGVNFILWYIEMKSGDGMTCRLLMDAEDGTVYAAKTEDRLMDAQGFAKNLWYHPDMWDNDMTDVVLQYCAAQYEATVGDGQTESRPWTPDAGSSQALLTDGGTERLQGVTIVRESPESGQGRGKISFQLPYGENSLEMVIGIAERQNERTEQASKKSGVRLSCLDVLIGVSRIYELIPEFQ